MAIYKNSRNNSSQMEMRSENLRENYLNTRDRYLQSFENNVDVVERNSTLEVARQEADQHAQSLQQATHFLHLYDFENLIHCTAVYSQPSTQTQYHLGMANLYSLVETRSKFESSELVTGSEEEDLDEDSPSPSLIRPGSLIEVLEEGLGFGGEFDKILLLSGAGELIGQECFIQRKFVHRLTNTLKSLPLNPSTCRVTSDIEVTVCDATSPQWVNLPAPQFYAPRCEYWVTINTDYTDTGGDEFTFSGRKEEAKSLAIRYLLEYYDKIRDPDILRIFDGGSYKFAKVAAWYIGSTPSNKLKILVTFPAKYVDRIPKQTTNLNNYLEDMIPNWATSVVFRSNQIHRDIYGVVSLLESFQTNKGFQDSNYFGPAGYSKFSFSDEALRLGEFIMQLENFMRTNRHPLRRQESDKIEIGFGENFRVLYVLLDQGMGSIPLTVGLQHFANNEPCNMSRVMGLVAATHQIAQDVNKNKGSYNFRTFITDHVFPPPTQNRDKKDNCVPDPLNPLKCCDIDLLSGINSIGEQYSTIGKNTLSKINSIFSDENDPNRLSNLYSTYASGHRPPVSEMCGNSRDTMDMINSVEKSIDGLTAAVECSQDPKKSYNEVAKCSQDQIYDEKSSPLKNKSVKILEDEDIKKIAPGLFSCIKNEYNFVTDPALEKLIDRLTGKDQFGAQNKFFASEQYSPPTGDEIRDYLQKIDYFSLVRKALTCTCNVLENYGDRAIMPVDQLDQMLSGDPSAEGSDWTFDAWFSKRDTMDSIKRSGTGGLTAEEQFPGGKVKSYIKVNDPDKQYSSIPRTSLMGMVSAGETPAARGTGDIVTDVGDIGGPTSGKPMVQPYAAQAIDWAAKNSEKIGIDLTDPVNAQVAHALVCQDLCKAVPVVCSCIDLTLPQIKFPEFSIEGIFGYLFQMLLDILIDILINILLGILYKLIDDLMRCEFDQASEDSKEDFRNSIGSIPFGSMGELESGGQPLDIDLLRPYLADVPQVISPPEFCALIRGEAGQATLSTLEDLMDSLHPGLRAYISTRDQIKELFITVGRNLGDNIRICDDLANLTRRSGNRTMADHVCDSVDFNQVQENLRAGTTTPEQISEILSSIRLCRQQRTIAIADVARELSGDPSGFFEKLIPKIIGAPGEDSLIPRDPPELMHMVSKVIDTVFDPTKMAFERDVSSFGNSLVEYKTDNIGPSQISELLNKVLTDEGDAALDGLEATEEMEKTLQWLRSVARISGGSATKNDIETMTANNFAFAKEPKDGKIGYNIDNDIKKQDNFLYDPEVARSRPSISTSFKLKMSPYETLNYDNLELVFEPQHNLSDWIPSQVTSDENYQRIMAATGMNPVNVTLSLNYHLPLSSYCHRWDKERDFYEIEVYNEGGYYIDSDSEVTDALAPGPLLTIAGEKRLNSDVKASMEAIGYADAKGHASIPQEVFAHWMSGIWNSVLDNNTTVERDLADPVYTKYLTNSFNKITEEMIQSIAANVATSRFFDIATLENIKLSSDLSCFPPRDSLVAIDKITGRTKDSYYGNKITDDHETRLTIAVTDGAIHTFIRVCVLEFALSGIFPFSKFNIESLMDDSFVRMCVRHVRDNLVLQGPFPLNGITHGFEPVKEFLKSAGVYSYPAIKGLTSWSDTFYEEFLRWCQISIFNRIESSEVFVNPFTDQEVVVTVEPINKQERISVDFWGETLNFTDYYAKLSIWNDLMVQYVITIGRQNIGDTYFTRENFGLIDAHLELMAVEKALLLDYIEGIEKESEFSLMKTTDDIRFRIFDQLRYIFAYVTSPEGRHELDKVTYAPDFGLGEKDFISEEFKIPYPEYDSEEKQTLLYIVNQINSEELGIEENIVDIFESTFIDKLTFNRWIKEATLDTNCECIPISSDELLSGEVSDGEQINNKPQLGYLEFLVLEQLYSVSQEIESYLGSDIYDLNKLLLGEYQLDPSGDNSLINRAGSSIVSTILDVPLDPSIPTSQGIPANILDGTEFPFVMEKYVKIIDYGQGFWDDLSRGLAPASLINYNLTESELKELHDLYAPENRVYEVQSETGELITIKISPQPDSNTTILPSAVWFKWIESRGHTFGPTSEGPATIIPIWIENGEDSNNLKFNYEALFSDIYFGLRLNHIDPIDLRYTSQGKSYTEEEVVEMASDATLSAQEFEALQRRLSNEAQAISSSLSFGFDGFLDKIPLPVKEKISKEYKAFFLEQNTVAQVSIMRNGSGVTIAEEFTYPAGRTKYISLPVLIKEERLQNEIISASKDTKAANRRLQELIVASSSGQSYLEDNFQIPNLPRLIYSSILGSALEPPGQRVQWSTTQATSPMGDSDKIISDFYIHLYGLKDKYLDKKARSGSRIKFKNLCENSENFTSSIDLLMDITSREAGTTDLYTDILKLQKNIESYRFYINNTDINVSILAPIKEDISRQYSALSSKILTLKNNIESVDDEIILSWSLPQLPTLNNDPYDDVYNLLTRLVNNSSIRSALGPAGYNQYRSLVLIQILSSLTSHSSSAAIQSSIADRKEEFKKFVASDCWNNNLMQKFKDQVQSVIAELGSTPSSRPLGSSLRTQYNLYLEYQAYAIQWGYLPLPLPDEAGSDSIARGAIASDSDRIALDLRRKTVFEHNQNLAGNIEKLFISVSRISNIISSHMNLADSQMTFYKNIKKALVRMNKVFINFGMSREIEETTPISDLTPNINAYYKVHTHPTLLGSMFDSSDYALLTEHIFPVKRLASLVSKYSSVKVASIIADKGIFSDSKLNAKQIFVSNLSSNVSDENGRPGWYRVDIFELMNSGAFGPLPWWLRLIQTDLSFNLIEFISTVPNKLLQLILSVPFFSSIVDPLCSVLSGWPLFNNWTTCKDLLGRLPPNKKEPPKQLGAAGNPNCGTPKEIEQRKADHEATAVSKGRPDSLTRPENSDLPFYS